MARLGVHPPLQRVQRAMVIQIEQRNTVCRLLVNGAFTVETGAFARDQIHAVVSRCGNVDVDLSGIGEIDAAGLQLMLQLKRRHGKSLRFVNHSVAVLRRIAENQAALAYSERRPT